MSLEAFFKSTLLLTAILKFSFASAQLSGINSKQYNIVIPKGFYIRLCPYTLTLDSTADFYVTYDNRPADKFKNSFTFVPTKASAYLRVCKINLKDTTLVLEERIRIIEPDYKVSLFGRQPEKYLNRSDFGKQDAYIQVNVENYDISYADFPVSRVVIKYLKDGVFKESEFKGGIIPSSIMEEIRRIKSEFVILEVQIKIENDFINLDPKIFYIKD